MQDWSLIGYGFILNKHSQSIYILWKVWQFQETRSLRSSKFPTIYAKTFIRAERQMPQCISAISLSLVENEGTNPKGTTDSRIVKEEDGWVAALQANVFSVRPGPEWCCGGCALWTKSSLANSEPLFDTWTHQLALIWQFDTTTPQRRAAKTTWCIGKW